MSSLADIIRLVSIEHSWDEASESVYITRNGYSLLGKIF